MIKGPYTLGDIVKCHEGGLEREINADGHLSFARVVWRMEGDSQPNHKLEETGRLLAASFEMFEILQVFAVNNGTPSQRKAWELINKIKTPEEPCRFFRVIDRDYLFPAYLVGTTLINGLDGTPESDKLPREEISKEDFQVMVSSHG